MKKSTVKKLLVAMLSFAMVFAMAACGGGSSSGDEGSSEGAAGALKIFLHFWKKYHLVVL